MSRSPTRRIDNQGALTDYTPVVHQLHHQQVRVRTHHPNQNPISITYPPNLFQQVRVRTLRSSQNQFSVTPLQYCRITTMTYQNLLPRQRLRRFLQSSLILKRKYMMSLGKGEMVPRSPYLHQCPSWVL